MPTVNEEAIGKLTYDEIIRAVQDLSPGYRTVFNLFIIEGLSRGDFKSPGHINRDVEVQFVESKETVAANTF